MAPGLEQELGCLLRTLGLRSPSIGGVSGRESRPIGETGAGLRSDSGPHWGRTWEPDEDRSGQAACPPSSPCLGLGGMQQEEGIPQLPAQLLRMWRFLIWG